MMVPFMLAWMPQWYVKVPGVSNVNENEEPFPSASLTNKSSSASTMCSTLSWFVQVTLVPALTVRVAGEKVKPEI